MARDLREIMVAIRISSDLERIGDLAKNIAKRSHALSEQMPRKLMAGLTRMGRLSLEQLKRIYMGEVTNWKQVGGADAPITLYGRENSSGTYVYFKDHVLGGRDFSPRCQTLPGTAAVVNAVAKDPNGIGYGGGAYARGVKECAVKPTATGKGVLPTLETVRDGSYPLARPLFLYTRTRPAGDVKKFVEIAFTEVPRIPLFQPYLNVAMQKNVTGYRYWFHRQLDYRSLVKA